MVQATENIYVLISKLKSTNFEDTLIVTSIQKMSNIKEEGFNVHDIQRGDVRVEGGKTFWHYVIEYQAKAKDAQIRRVSYILGVDEEKLRNMMALHLSESNMNEFGRFNELKETVDKKKAREFFEKLEGIKLPPPKVNIKIGQFLKEFILSGGYDIELAEGDI